MTRTMMEHQEWNSPSSAQWMEFERKPLLSDISVVIPTLGRPILEQCLYTILMGSTWPACLIVVEQGSNINVVEWLERVRLTGIPVHHVLSTQRGRSAGVNRGIEQATTRYVAITDDDCLVDKHWLANMMKELRKHPNEVITGRVEAAGESMIVITASITPGVQGRPRLQFDSMSGGNMGASLEVFKKVGPFEEDSVLHTAEDAEWAYRALRKRVAIRYEPGVIVAHFGWRDLEMRTEQYHQYALSHGGFYGRYLRKGDLFILLRSLVHFARACRRWIIGRITGDEENARNGKAYCLGLLPGIVAGFRSRHQ